VTVVLVLGMVAGLGAVGVFRGLYAAPPSLDALAAVLERSVGVHEGPAPGLVDATGSAPEKVYRYPRAWVAHTGTVTLDRFCRSRLAVHPRWAGVLALLAVTGGSAERLAATVVVAGAAGLLGPPVLWLAALPAGSSIPAGVPIVVGLLAAPVCAGMPLLTLAERAKDRRRHFRAVVGSTVDLVVLSLAGGMGIEGALLAATQLSPDWASRQMSRVLLQARDSGQSPWHALGRLGGRMGVPELEELASSLQLAGTEGAKIRQALTARAVSLRRHEQAEAESAANAMTERLFLPGALLLIGFLFFVGYPAFSRILGGW